MVTYFFHYYEANKKTLFIVPRRFYHDHDRKVDGSTPTQASLLRPRIRCFTIIIFAWWNLTSSKLKKSEAKFKGKARKQGQLLSESGFVLCIAPPSLPRDRRINTKKSNQTLLFNALLLGLADCTTDR